MKAIVIRPGERAVLQEVDGWNGIKAALGGGYLEAVPVGEDFTLYVDEDGIAKGLPYNEEATRVTETMLAAMKRRFAVTGDYIKGVAVFVGIRHDPEEGGVECDIPERVIAEYFAPLK